jgi:hypothetical protein
VDKNGVEFIMHRLDGYRLHIEVQHNQGLLTIVGYEAARDDELLAHVRIESGPYASREALLAAVDTAIRQA